MKFIDQATIHVKAGDGGVGCVSFRREKYVPRGGPNGGDGGRGGSIIIRANRQLSTLLDYRYKPHYKAPRGAHGLGANKTGRSGTDVILQVPTGTVIRDLGTGEIIADMLDDAQDLVVATGGRGAGATRHLRRQRTRHHGNTNWASPVKRRTSRWS